MAQTKLIDAYTEDEQKTLYEELQAKFNSGKGKTEKVDPAILAYIKNRDDRLTSEIANRIMPR